MLAHGWWRVNYDCKSAILTLEGDQAGINRSVKQSVISLVDANRPGLNGLTFTLLDGKAMNHRARLLNHHRQTPG